MHYFDSEIRDEVMKTKVTLALKVTELEQENRFKLSKGDCCNKSHQKQLTLT